MKSLRMLLIGAALITGGSALASAQPIENHNWAYSNHDRDRDKDRDRDRDRREIRDHDRDDQRRFDRDDYRGRDRDDRRVYEQRRMHWDGYRWVY